MSAETNKITITFSDKSSVTLTQANIVELLSWLAGGGVIKTITDSLSTINTTLTNFPNSGIASQAKKLVTARTINGVVFDGTANITITATANGGTSAACSGNSATATKLQTARTINGVAFDGTKNITITAAANGGNADTVDNKHATDVAGQIALKDVSNDLNCRLLRSTYANQATISGAIAYRINNSSDNYTRYCSDPAAIRTFLGLGNVDNTSDANKTVAKVSTAVAAGDANDLVYGTMASNDQFRIRIGGTSDNGYVELATADNGNEPIYLRQYNGVFTSLVRTATLLDAGGNTSFPGTVTAPTFNGTATNASKVSNYSVGNAAGKIPVYSSDGHLVLPSGIEIW